MKTSERARAQQDPAKQQRTAVAIVEILGAHGRLIDEQIAAYFAELARTRDDLPTRSPSALRNARLGLVRQGRVRDSGYTDETSFGCAAVLWELEHA